VSTVFADYATNIIITLIKHGNTEKCDFGLSKERDYKTLSFTEIKIFPVSIFPTLHFNQNYESASSLPRPN